MRRHCEADANGRGESDHGVGFLWRWYQCLRHVIGVDGKLEERERMKDFYRTHVDRVYQLMLVAGDDIASVDNVQLAEEMTERIFVHFARHCSPEKVRDLYALTWGVVGRDEKVIRDLSKVSVSTDDNSDDERVSEDEGLRGFARSFAGLTIPERWYMLMRGEDGFEPDFVWEVMGKDRRRGEWMEIQMMIDMKGAKLGELDHAGFVSTETSFYRHN